MSFHCNHLDYPLRVKNLNIYIYLLCRISKNDVLFTIIPFLAVSLRLMFIQIPFHSAKKQQQAVHYFSLILKRELVTSLTITQN